MFANQGNDDIAVAPVDLDVVELGGCARRVLFGSGAANGAELSERSGYLWWDERALLATDEIALPGAHNRENAMAVAAVCLARGVDQGAVVQALKSFRGVPHRLELIATQRGVSYVNDSKATNVSSTIVALRSYRSGIRLIAGGRGKRQDFSPLAPLVAERCRAVYLIGEATEDLAAALASTRVELHRCGELERAVAAARDCARDGEVVLLSPACASYDQYSDFEARESISAGWWRGADGAGRGHVDASPAAGRRPSRRRGRAQAPARRVLPPLEHRIMMTATLCLLAFGAVMVYSASSPLGVLGGRGYGTGEFVRYLGFGAVGLGGMYVLERRGLALLDRRFVTLLLTGSFSSCSSSCWRPASASACSARSGGSPQGRSSSSLRS